MSKDTTIKDLSEGKFENAFGITKDNISQLTEKYSNAPYGNKKGQKKITCIVLTAVKGAMPTLVAKPKKVKYGTKWFSRNNGTYFINYSALIDVGRHYLYMTTENNAVGACYLQEHMEFADANQVEMLENQHAVEVFKKNRGIPVKMLLILGIILLICVLIIAIAVINIIGMNNTIVNQKNQITNLTTENNNLKQQAGAIIQ